MTEHQSSRTLVKSAPELWAECSDAASLARHLGAFGEIRITKLEPETAVAWEGAAASGTVKLETSGWGTRVTLTVKEEAAPPVKLEALGDPRPEPVQTPEPEPVAFEESVQPEPEPASAAVEALPRAGRFARFRAAFRRKPQIAEPVVDAPPDLDLDPEPAPVMVTDPEPEHEPQPAAEAAPEPERVAPDPPLAPAPEPPRLNGEEALVAALDSLGMAHHRPYSRA